MIGPRFDPTTESGQQQAAPSGASGPEKDAARTALLAVGPRKLPAEGSVLVWVDSGSAAGREVWVSVDSLRIDNLDDGQGSWAIYEVRPV